MNEHIMEEGRRCLRGHVSIIPIGRDKQPCFSLLPHKADGTPSWDKYKEERITEEILADWCRSPDILGLGAVGGKVSEGLIIIDFDDASVFEPWLAACGADAADIPWQQTGGGNYQAAWRCANPGGNRVLAMLPDATRKRGWRPRIEIRAEGGYGCIPPTLHPSGKKYRWGRGHFADAPVFNEEHSDRLLRRAMDFNIPPEIPDSLTRRATRKQRDATRDQRESATRDDELRAMFRKEHTIDSMLNKCGYMYHQSSDYYIRPGSRYGTPSVMVINNEVSVHYSSSDDAFREPFGVHDSFGLWCIYMHDNKYNKAMNAWAAKNNMVRHDTQEAPRPLDHTQPLWHKSAGGKSVVITDNQWVAEELFALGISVVYTDHGRWPRAWIDEVKLYEQRYVVFHPLDGAAQNLTRVIGGVLVETLPEPLGAFITNYDGSSDQMKRELAGYLAQARLLRRNDSTPNHSPLLTKTV